MTSSNDIISHHPLCECKKCLAHYDESGVIRAMEEIENQEQKWGEQRVSGEDQNEQAREDQDRFEQSKLDNYESGLFRNAEQR